MNRKFLNITQHPFERNPEIFTDFKVPESLKIILRDLEVSEEDDDYELYVLFFDEQLVFKNSLYSFSVKIEILDTMKDFVRDFFEGFKLHISPNLILESVSDTISIAGWNLTDDEKKFFSTSYGDLVFPWKWFFCCETAGGYLSYSLQ